MNLNSEAIQLAKERKITWDRMKVPQNTGPGDRAHRVQIRGRGKLLGGEKERERERERDALGERSEGGAVGISQNIWKRENIIGITLGKAQAIF